MNTDKKYKVLEKTDPINSVTTLIVEIDKDFVNSFRDGSIKDLNEELEFDGFRKGNAPEKMVVEKVGELKVFEKNTFKAINTIVPLILAEEKLNTITMPNISLNKITPNANPEIKIELTLMPEVVLADYKKISKEIIKTKNIEATDEEVSGYIENIRKNKAKKIKKDSGENSKEEETLPELNDEFVKSLGDFQDVEDFKNKLKENISRDKELNENQKRRIAIIEEIIKQSKIQMPEVLIEEEQERMLHEFRARVEEFKMDFEEYLSTIKKTTEELKKEWRADSEKRAKMNLILPKIAREENIKVDEEELKKEVGHLKEHHKDIDENIARLYVSNILSNQKVFEFLEKL